MLEVIYNPRDKKRLTHVALLAPEGQAVQQVESAKVPPGYVVCRGALQKERVVSLRGLSCIDMRDLYQPAVIVGVVIGPVDG